MAKGQKNCHVFFNPDKHFYSIPNKYIGQQLRIVYDAKNVEIYTSSYQRITLHQRNIRAYGYTTIKEHLPPTHRFVLDWSPEKFISQAELIGKDTTEAIKTILASKSHPEQSYKSCMGVLSLAKKTGNIRLNAACKRALYFDACNYKIIKRILENSQDTLPIEAPDDNHIPEHKNQRGGDYYQ